MSESIICLEHLVKKYGNKPVLNDITLDVQKGDIYGLIGKNGAGKTTIFKIILGLSSFNSGILRLRNDEKNLSEERKKIGFMIGTNLFGYMNAKQNLEYYRRLKQISDKSEINRVLKLVGLDGVKTKVKGYSLGMKQRLGIANAIMGNPEILLLDEPTNGLDPQGIADIRDLIKRLNKDFGMTIIVSSHILGELQNTATRFGIVNNGVIVKELTQEDLQISDDVIRIHVDDLEKARQVLAENGVTLLEEHRESRSLEEFYFSLIGGGDHNA